MADFIYGFVQRSDLRRYAIQTVTAVTFVLVAVTAVMFGLWFADADSVKALFAAADERGLRDVPVIMLHGISHNAEFYAAGRIVRESDGKQKRFFGPREVSEELRKHSGQNALVIVPVEYLSQLLSSEYLHPELIKENGEVALVAVKEKWSLFLRRTAEAIHQCRTDTDLRNGLTEDPPDAGPIALSEKLKNLSGIGADAGAYQCLSEWLGAFLQTDERVRRRCIQRLSRFDDHNRRCRRIV